MATKAKVASPDPKGSDPMFVQNGRLNHTDNISSNATNSQCYEEVARLSEANFSVIPLGGGEDGKSPLVKFKNRVKLPVQTVLNRMASVGSNMFAIQCHDMVVVDCDTDNAETLKLVRDRFGWSDVRTKTPRGLHLYFRAGEQKAPQSVRSKNIAIDFKSGKNQYVVGAHSMRPDGGEYIVQGQPLETVSYTHLTLPTNREV